MLVDFGSKRCEQIQDNIWEILSGLSSTEWPWGNSALNINLSFWPYNSLFLPFRTSQA